MKTFRWNPEKNEWLSQKRTVTFEEIVAIIEESGVIAEADHHNPGKYPNQKILIVNVDGYAYLVPCVIQGEEYFLKTIIPSRKATKHFIGGKHEKEKHSPS